MRFPNEFEGSASGVFGFKFKDINNYYALIVKRKILPEDDVK